jgi:hypothetical protein
MPEVTARDSLGFMRRPRWHDALIVSGILALLALGVWALWWDDVRSWWHGERPAASAPAAPPATPGTTPI